MIRTAVTLALLYCVLSGSGQKIAGIDTTGAVTLSENIYNRKLAGDSLASSFCIVIKKEVKLHKHLRHSEHVLVLEGEGAMDCGEQSFHVKKGDLIFIPANTPHAVKRTGAVPLKMLSIQSPHFDGTDRVSVSR